MDNDGDLDAVFAVPNGPNQVYLNDGSALFSDTGQTLGINLSEGVDLGDIDGDGSLDAVFANTSSGANPDYTQ